MATLAIPVSSHDHVRGRPDAGLTVVQYGDFQCPHCARIFPMLLDIAEEVGDSVAFAFRHFPLAGHPLAQRAAEAAEAAASQGRFWEMAKLLYENQERLDEDRLIRCAKKADVQMKRFRKDMEAGLHAPRVRADYLGGLRSGVKGTPTLFIKGRLYEGAHNSEALVAALVEVSKGR